MDLDSLADEIVSLFDAYERAYRPHAPRAGEGVPFEKNKLGQWIDRYGQWAKLPGFRGLREVLYARPEQRHVGVPEGQVPATYEAGRWSYVDKMPRWQREQEEMLEKHWVKHPNEFKDRAALREEARLLAADTAAVERRTNYSLHNGGIEVRLNAELADRRGFDTRILTEQIDWLAALFPPPPGNNNRGLLIHVSGTGSFPDAGYRGDLDMLSLSDAWLTPGYADQRIPTADRYMPTASTTPALVYALTHEWGHLASGALARDDPWWRKHFKDSPEMSEKGRTNAREGYAEAFAEWLLSQGQTTNPVARQYAAHYGWPVWQEAS